MVNEKFYCDVLRWLRENIRGKCPDRGRNNSWSRHHDKALAHPLLIVQHLLAFMKMTFISHPPYSPDNARCDFYYFQRWNWSSRGDVLTELKRSRPTRRMWWRLWHKMTSSSASDHGNPTGIAVSMQKRTTSKGMAANRNFSKWLSYGRGILGTFG
jgi:hypothetical protein